MHPVTAPTRAHQVASQRGNSLGSQLLGKGAVVPHKGLALNTQQLRQRRQQELEVTRAAATSARGHHVQDPQPKPHTS